MWLDQNVKDSLLCRKLQDRLVFQDVACVKDGKNMKNIKFRASLSLGNRHVKLHLMKI